MRLPERWPSSAASTASPLPAPICRQRGGRGSPRDGVLARRLGACVARQHDWPWLADEGGRPRRSSFSVLQTTEDPMTMLAAQQLSVNRKALQRKQIRIFFLNSAPDSAKSG
jgi:hypothetical protein